MCATRIPKLSSQSTRLAWECSDSRTNCGDGHEWEIGAHSLVGIICGPRCPRSSHGAPASSVIEMEAPTTFGGNAMRVSAVRMVWLLALGGLASVSCQALAQGLASPVQAAESRGVPARPAEVTISIRVDRLLGRIDVTTTIPVDDPPAVPRSRFEFPAARTIDGPVRLMIDEVRGRRGQDPEGALGLHEVARTPASKKAD